jgi:hypothetical protein
MSEEFIEANGNDPKRVFAICMLSQIAKRSGLEEKNDIDSFISNAIQDQAEKSGRSAYDTPLGAAISFLWNAESSLRYEKDRHTSLNKKHRQIRNAVIDATTEHSGCVSGKLEFLENCGIFPGDDDFPTRTYCATRIETQSVEVPMIDDQMDDFAREWIDENVDWNGYDVEIQVEEG